MAEDTYKRKLSAILSADVAGYSRLMRDDEDATVRTLIDYRNALTHFIHQYRGRVVDSPGDNILAEFTSVVDAVNCGVEIQRDLAERNVELPENRRMQFRIGINLGDMIEEGNRIYGDGVNIAARMEGLAEVGEICISGTVYDAIENKIGLEYEYLGEHAVKNIDKPIRAYKVLTFPGAAAHRSVKAKQTKGRAWRKVTAAMIAVFAIAIALAAWYLDHRHPQIETAVEDKMAFPLPQKPSIVVLPFIYIGGNPEHEFLCDGITEDIITALSKTPKLMVIARTSSYAYKDKSASIAQISQDLGVQYILEGSLRSSENQIRITAQLIDAINGYHVWADNFDRDILDFFEAEEEILLNILVALQVHLTEGDQAQIWRKEATSITAYLKMQKGLENFRKFTREGVFRSRELAQEVIEIDPDYASGYRLLAWSYWMGARFKFDSSPSDSIEKAISIAGKVLSIDKNDSSSYYLLGGIHLIKHNHSAAIEAITKAHELSPNHADILAYKALVYNYSGMPQDALSAVKSAMRLNPHYTGWYEAVLGVSYQLLGNYDLALDAFEKWSKRMPGSYIPQARLAIIYSLLGRIQDAEVKIKRILEMNPNFSIDLWRKSQLYRSQEESDLEINALRNAGLT